MCNHCTTSKRQGNPIHPLAPLRRRGLALLGAQLGQACADPAAGVQKLLHVDAIQTAVRYANCGTVSSVGTRQ